MFYDRPKGTVRSRRPEFGAATGRGVPQMAGSGAAMSPLPAWGICPRICIATLPDGHDICSSDRMNVQRVRLRNWLRSNVSAMAWCSCPICPDPLHQCQGQLPVFHLGHLSRARQAAQLLGAADIEPDLVDMIPVLPPAGFCEARKLGRKTPARWAGVAKAEQHVRQWRVISQLGSHRPPFRRPAGSGARHNRWKYRISRWYRFVGRSVVWLGASILTKTWRWLMAHLSMRLCDRGCHVFCRRCRAPRTPRPRPRRRCWVGAANVGALP